MPNLKAYRTPPDGETQGWQVCISVLLFVVVERPHVHLRVNRTTEALMNTEVLHLIFEHFDLQLQIGSHSVAQTTRNLAQIRKDLLSAAKTCKAFVEPALNSLWRVLPSLLPLLLLLPSAEVEGGYYVSARSS